MQEKNYKKSPKRLNNLFLSGTLNKSLLEQKLIKSNMSTLKLEFCIMKKKIIFLCLATILASSLCTTQIVAKRKRITKTKKIANIAIYSILGAGLALSAANAALSSGYFLFEGCTKASRSSRKSNHLLNQFIQNHKFEAFAKSIGCSALLAAKALIFGYAAKLMFQNAEQTIKQKTKK